MIWVVDIYSLQGEVQKCSDEPDISIMATNPCFCIRVNGKTKFEVSAVSCRKS